MQQPNIRICRLKRWSNYPGFGIHLLRSGNDRGIQVGDVEPGSPAASCGLLAGDKIVEINKRNVENEKFMNVLQLLQTELPKDTIEFMVVDRDNAGIRVDRNNPNIQVKETAQEPRGQRSQDENRPEDAYVLASLMSRDKEQTWDNVMKNVMENLPTIEPKSADETAVTPAQLDQEFQNALRTKLGDVNQNEDWYKGSERLEKMMTPSKNRTYKANVVSLEKRSDFNGLGLSLSPDADVGHVISEVAPNSPASRAGVKRGDCILQIGEEVVLQLAYKDLAQRLQQTPGKINLSVAPKDVILKCAIEHVPIVTQTDKSSPSAMGDRFQQAKEAFQQPSGTRPSGSDRGMGGIPSQPQYQRPQHYGEPKPSLPPQQVQMRPDYMGGVQEPQTPPTGTPEAKLPGTLGYQQGQPTQNINKPPAAEFDRRASEHSPQQQQPKYYGEAKPSLPPQQVQMRPDYMGQHGPQFPPIRTSDAKPQANQEDQRGSKGQPLQKSSLDEPEYTTTDPVPRQKSPAKQAPPAQSRPYDELANTQKQAAPQATQQLRTSLPVADNRQSSKPKKEDLKGPAIPTKTPDSQKSNKQIATPAPAAVERKSQPKPNKDFPDRQSDDLETDSDQRLVKPHDLKDDVRRVNIRRGNNSQLGFELKTLAIDENAEKIHAFGNIQPNLPADLAGVREGDILETVNGIPVTGKEHQEVLQILREHVNDLDLELRTDPQVQSIFKTSMKPIQETPSTTTDERSTTKSQLPEQDDEIVRSRIEVPPNADSLGLRVTPGLVIHHVTPGSPADAAGLRVNDTIVELDNKPVSIDNYSDAFALLKEGFRRKKMDIAVKRPESSSSSAIENDQSAQASSKTQSESTAPPSASNSDDENNESTSTPDIRKPEVSLPGSRLCKISDLVPSKPIGLTLKESYNRPHEISKIVQGSPADASGLKVHDLVLKVNGDDVSKSTFNDVKSKIGGSISSGDVNLEVIADELYPQQEKQKSPSEILAQKSPSEILAQKRSESPNKTEEDTFSTSPQKRTSQDNRENPENTKAQKFAQFTRKLSLAAKGKGYKKCIIPDASSATSLGFTVAGSSTIDGVFYTIDVLPDSQAALSGVEEGDMLVDINGQSLKSQTFDKAIDLLKLEAEKDPLHLGLINHKDLTDDSKLAAEIASGSLKKKQIKKASYTTVGSRFDLTKKI